jgi:NADH:ubiquinone oxidoreductase subunit K
MNLPPVGLHYYVIVSALLFGLGAFGVISRRNAIAVLMSIELMLNAAALNFVAFWRYSERASEATGPVFALIIITVAAAEAAVGLAIIIAVFRGRESVDADRLNLMKW